MRHMLPRIHRRNGNPIQPQPQLNWKCCSYDDDEIPCWQTELSYPRIP